MNFYQRLIRSAWRSGDYSVGAAERDNGASAGDSEGLRPFLRSKMEWIVEREAYDMDAAKKQEDRTMKLAQYVKFREEKFGGVLFETRSEKVFTLSPTGAAVVREIVAGGGSDVVGRLKARYEDPKGTLEREASEFIAQLKTQGLITE